MAVPLLNYLNRVFKQEPIWLALACLPFSRDLAVVLTYIHKVFCNILGSTWDCCQSFHGCSNHLGILAFKVLA